MRLARVEGNVVATRKHPSLEGWRLVVCQPINLGGEDDGTPIVAIDPHDDFAWIAANNNEGTVELCLLTERIRK